MRRKKHFFVHCDMYHMGLWISVCETDKEVMKYMKDYYTEDQLNDITGNNFKYGKAYLTNQTGFLRFKNLPNTPFEWSIISHEVFHMTHFILDFIDVKYSMKCDEVFTYLNAWIFRNVMASILGVDVHQKIRFQKR